MPTSLRQRCYVPQPGVAARRPLTGQSGTATITVKVSDGSLSTEDSFLFTVSPPADYIVATSATSISVTDKTGHGNTLVVSQPSAGKIRFTATGAATRTFSVNGAASVNDSSGDLILTAGITKVTINAGAGNDTVNAGLTPEGRGGVLV